MTVGRRAAGWFGAAVGLPLLFWLRYGVIDGFAIGFTAFLLLLIPFGPLASWMLVSVAEPDVRNWYTLAMATVQMRPRAFASGEPPLEIAYS